MDRWYLSFGQIFLAPSCLELILSVLKKLLALEFHLLQEGCSMPMLIEAVSLVAERWISRIWMILCLWLLKKKEFLLSLIHCSYPLDGIHCVATWSILEFSLVFPPRSLFSSIIYDLVGILGRRHGYWKNVHHK